MSVLKVLIASSEVIDVDTSLLELEQINKFRAGFEGKAAVKQIDWMADLLGKLLKEIKAEAEGGWFEKG